jgi:hypothetical protein
MKIVAVASLSLALVICGCTALGKFASVITPTATTILDTAVSIAVTAELIKDPATTKLKAVAIKAIAEQILADTANPTTTVATIEADLNARLAQLAPNPIIAASILALTGGIQGALNNYISAGVSATVTQNTLIAMKGIATEVAAVCTFYGG